MDVVGHSSQQTTLPPRSTATCSQRVGFVCSVSVNIVVLLFYCADTFESCASCFQSSFSCSCSCALSCAFSSFLVPFPPFFSFLFLPPPSCLLPASSFLFSSCSPVSSAHLFSLGIVVDLLWVLSDPQGLHAQRLIACSTLAALVAQPSCGSQVRASLLRMLPVHLLHMMLVAEDERNNNNNNNSSNNSSNSSNNHDDNNSSSSSKNNNNNNNKTSTRERP